jgi:hypothetical protein
VDIDIDDLLGHEAKRKRFDMRSRRGVVGRADERVGCQLWCCRRLPFFDDDDLSARIPGRDRRYGAGTTTAQHHYIGLFIPTDFARISSSLDSLFTNFFNRKFFEKTFTLQLVNDAFVKITLDLKVSFGAAALLLHLLQNSAQTGAPHARRKAKNTGVDIQVLFDDLVIFKA